MQRLGPNILPALRALHTAATARRVFRCEGCDRKLDRNVALCPDCVRERNQRRVPKQAELPAVPARRKGQ